MNLPTEMTCKWIALLIALAMAGCGEHVGTVVDKSVLPAHTDPGYMKPAYQERRKSYHHDADGHRNRPNETVIVSFGLRQGRNVTTIPRKEPHAHP